MREVSRRLLFIAIASTLFCAAGCETWTDTGAGKDNLIKTELYFGLSRSDGSTITENEWDTFVDEYITPRFKEGLTIVDAAGQCMRGNGELIKEGTKIVILFHRNSGDKKAAIEYIRDKYKELFDQEAVIKVTSYPEVLAIELVEKKRKGKKWATTRARKMYWMPAWGKVSSWLL